MRRTEARQQLIAFVVVTIAEQINVHKAVLSTPRFLCLSCSRHVVGQMSLATKPMLY